MVGRSINLINHLIRTLVRAEVDLKTEKVTEARTNNSTSKTLISPTEEIGVGHNLEAGTEVHREAWVRTVSLRRSPFQRLSLAKKQE